jgi:8-oxo-dGTP pyrophosphatase MutT (NUDIX family)
MDYSPDRIRAVLQGLDLHVVRREGPASPEAAVLIGLRYFSQEPVFVLTRRTESVATHKGQISFPGGVRESRDRSLVETALRETEEEVGIAAAQIRVLGEFHEYEAVTGLPVRPVVGVYPEESRYRPQQEEVAYMLEVPVRFFRDVEPRVEQRTVRGAVHDVYYYDFAGEIIWGLTARMIRDFIRELGDAYHGHPCP